MTRVNFALICCIALFFVLCTAAPADTNRPQTAVNPDTTGVSVLPKSDSQNAKVRAVVDPSDKDLSKITFDPIDTENEVVIKDEHPKEEATETGNGVHTTARTSLQTSARVNCFQFSRCNYLSTTRCWTAPTVIWYARYFTQSGNCNGKVYISGSQICMRGGPSYCCARMVYIRA